MLSQSLFLTKSYVAPNRIAIYYHLERAACIQIDLLVPPGVDPILFGHSTEVLIRSLLFWHQSQEDHGALGTTKNRRWSVVCREKLGGVHRPKQIKAVLRR